VDIVAATYAQEEEDDDCSLPDIDDDAMSDLDDADLGDVADGIPGEHAEPQECAQPQLDSRLRSELRDVLHYIKSASYDVPLTAVQSVLAELEVIRNLMAVHLTADLGLNMSRARRQHGKNRACMWIITSVEFDFTWLTSIAVLVYAGVRPAAGSIGHQQPELQLASGGISTLATQCTGESCIETWSASCWWGACDTHVCAQMNNDL
jgi:hypothetical protein